MLKITMSYENENETDKAKANEILSNIKPTGPVKSNNNGKFQKIYLKIK